MRTDPVHETLLLIGRASRPAASGETREVRSPADGSVVGAVPVATGDDVDEAVEVVLRAIEKAGYTAGDDIVLAIDAAASEFHKDGKYVLAGEGKTMDAAEMKWLYSSHTRKGMPARMRKRTVPIPSHMS